MVMVDKSLPPAVSASETYAEVVSSLKPEQFTPTVKSVVENALLDVAGLCVASRKTDYIRAVLSAWDGKGKCTALGHTGLMDSAGAAVVNGTAAHGEDYDDTFEGTPVHAGAVIIPAVLAACEQYGRSGGDALCGVVAGMELMCRLAVVAPTAIHRGGFHPTAVIGALGAAVGVGVALGHSPKQLTDAMGVAGSMASGIIEYLAEGTWTKRIHPGWAAQSGLRAALLGKHGFTGPRTVLEGKHGFFFAFGVPGIKPDFTRVTEALGETWQMEKIAFKPYACGTMLQPFIDCAIRLAREGLDYRDITHVLCNVGEGTVHRLWEPSSEKKHPTTPYSAKFSGPFCVAVGLVDRAAGLNQFTEAKISDPDILALTEKVEYRIDPEDEYPRNYSGHVRATLKDGSIRETRQPHLRGGVREPLDRSELVDKFQANLTFGGISLKHSGKIEDALSGLFDAPDMSPLAACRLNE